jgi:hypothetical protein
MQLNFLVAPVIYVVLCISTYFSSFPPFVIFHPFSLVVYLFLHDFVASTVFFPSFRLFCLLRLR